MEGFRGGGGGGAGALRDPIDSNRSFPVMSTLKKVLAAFEILRHMLDFKSNMSCLAVGQHTCGWASCITTLAANFVSCSALKRNV